MSADPKHIDASTVCDAMHRRIYGHDPEDCEPVCTDPVQEFASEALSVLRDPECIPAMLDALTRHGVLTEETAPNSLCNRDGWHDQRRLVTSWEVTS